MDNSSADDLDRNKLLSLPRAKEEKRRCGHKVARRGWMFLAAILLAPLIFAQSAPQVTGVEPASGKANDTVTVSGKDLGKDSVSSVFLSDDKSDYKAAIVEQNTEQIVVKVPQVKPGSYNISIQVGNKIFIKPLRFTVQG